MAKSEPIRFSPAAYVKVRTFGKCVFNLFCFALLVDEWWRRRPLDGGRRSLVVGIDTAVGAAKVTLYYSILIDNTNCSCKRESTVL